MKFIVAIPARGGSKRLPRKNILSLNGKPLIGYSIEYPLNELKEIDVYVSTDDREIAVVAEQFGAKVVDRPAALSGDHVSTAATLRHLSGVLESEGVDYDYMILLQCTNPLRPVGMLEEAVSIIEKKKCKSLVGVSKSITKLGKIEDGIFRPWNYRFGQRSQDMEPLYYENGLLYISHKSLIDNGEIIDSEPFAFVIAHPYAKIDIDTMEDFEEAEHMINRIENE